MSAAGGAPGKQLTEHPRGSDDDAFVCEGCGSDALPMTVVVSPPHEVVACTTCGLAATWPRLPLEDPTAVHGVAFFGARGGRRFTAPVELAVSLARAARAWRIARISPPGGRILDVGCGRGLMLGWLASMGYRCFGTEVSTLAGVFRQPPQGIEVRLGPLADLGLPGEEFDTVVFYHSLEHVPDLARTLAEVARISRPGGRLVVAVPNFASYQARYGGADWLHLDLPYHCHHFTPGALETALSLRGFEVETVRSHSLEYNPIAMLQTMLNTMGRPHNALFDAMRGERKAVVDLVLGAALGPAALGAALVEAALGSGGTFELVARRR